MYGCYRCGAIGGDVETISNEAPIILKCLECGEENTIVTLSLAMDLLNENHFHDRMRGGLCYEKSVDDVDEFLDSLPTENN